MPPSTNAASRALPSFCTASLRLCPHATVVIGASELSQTLHLPLPLVSLQWALVLDLPFQPSES